MTDQSIAETVETPKYSVDMVFEAKRPKILRTLDMGEVYDDRQIVWVGIGQIQYDSPTVKYGKRLPIIPIEKFEKWAGREVTSEMPHDGSWRSPKRS